MKKRTTILLIILLIVSIGGAAYWYITSQPSPEAPTEREGQDFDLPSFEDEVGGQGGGEGEDNEGNQGNLAFTPGIAPYQRLSNAVSDVVTLNSGATSSLRFIRRDSGHVYEMVMREETSRLTNTTIPRIQKVQLSAGGENLILQYFDESRQFFRTYLGTLVETVENEEGQTPYRISGSFLPDNVTGYDFSPSGDQLFYIRDITNGSEGIVYTLGTNTSEIIFTSKVSEWSVDWVGDTTIALQTKPSGEAEGYLYFLSTTGNLTRVLGEKGGLTTLVHPSLNTILYTGASNTINSYIYDREKREEVELGVKTLPEKCVWSTEESSILYCAVPQTLPRNTLYPDSWYRGDVSFNDAFWRINVATGNEQRIASPADFEEESVDAIDLHLIEEDEFLIFRNKKNGSLWSLRL